MRKSLNSLWSVSLLIGFSVGVMPASTITLDENGNGNINGTPLSFTASGTNPDAPHQTPVLIYTLPFAGVAGQVLLVEPESKIPGDVLQFTGNSTVIFYSKTDGDSLAEKYSPPIFPFPVSNSVSLTETVSGNTDGATYTPTAGQPGFDASGPTYHFISDVTSSAIPEPASVGMLLLGGAAFLAARKFRRA